MNKKRRRSKSKKKNLPNRPLVGSDKAERGRGVAREGSFERVGEHRLLVIGVVAFPAGPEHRRADLERMSLLDPPPVVLRRGAPVGREVNAEALADLLDHRIGLVLEGELGLQSLCNAPRSEEHTSELQSLMRISYAVFCLKKKNTNKTIDKTPPTNSQCIQKI